MDVTFSFFNTARQAQRIGLYFGSVNVQSLTQDRISVLIDGYLGQ